ncbi:MAG TPA: hypothetical protein ENN60_02625 [archaeon]|nr:hypothetical protein [archaeon]
MKLEWKKALRNPDKVFMVVACLLILWDFLHFPGMPSGPYHVDHSFHILKYELFAKHGFERWPELGNIDLKIFIPPFFIPFLMLAWVLPPAVAYLSTFFLMLAVTYANGKILRKPYRWDPVLAVLFPLSAFFFFRIGRILELAAHLPLLLLVAYLDDGKSKYMTTLLFALGATTHLPTALFYLPIILFKLWNRRMLDHLAFWGLLLLPWLGVYIPFSMDAAGWQVSRLEVIVLDIKATVTTSLMPPGVLDAILWGLVAMSLLVLLLGKEGRYAFPSFLITLVSTLMVYYGNLLPTHLPGFNQVIPITCFPLFSFLLLRHNRKVWRWVAWATLIILAIPLPWEGPTATDFPILDRVNGSVLSTSFPQGYREHRTFATNYLAYRGNPTPACTTWEYADPEWWFYEPESCEELKVGIDYIILHESAEWAKECGEWWEGEYLLVVRPAS